jgi:hypothetical protein
MSELEWMMYIWASFGIVSFVVTISILVYLDLKGIIGFGTALLIITSYWIIYSGVFYFIAIGINWLDFLIFFLGVVLGCIGLMRILRGMAKLK